MPLTTKMERIRRKFQTPIPLARIAVISLSAARRLNPIRIPTSTPAGMRDRESERQAEGQHFEHAAQRRAVAHHQFENVPEIVGEENERENRRADRGVGHSLRAGCSASESAWLRGCTPDCESSMLPQTHEPSV